MASTSASAVQRSFKYDVFLSFRGEDTRKTFVDHLYHALHNRGITTYKDDEKIEKGKRIDDQLMRSIEDSRIYIIVFSKNYASSSWCLDELVKIMECHKKTNQTAYPVFYNVEPTEIRHQSGVVGEAFAKHEQEEDAGKWRDAMTEAADLAGRELKTTFDGHEAKFIQKVVEDISLELRFIDSNVNGKLIGMETRVKKVVSYLEAGSNDVHMIGIKGIGGGGKTTLARAVFSRISYLFEGKSFVENVREFSKGSGLKELQKQILKDVLNDKNIDVPSVYEGENMMKKMLGSRKVLVVLDDVDDIEQLEALAGEHTWFKSGSTIIITTRDEHVLVAHRVKFIHDVNLLSHEERICLFSKYAFGKEIPIGKYEELSREVVYYAAGLPLTIKVLGSSLCGKTEYEWNDAIERLKQIPEKQTLKTLELSYIGLEHDHKEVFLEVACILKGEHKDKAIKILESCGFHARFALKVLEQKSLITVLNYGHLDMHDRIEEMGRNIIHRLHPHEPQKHTRLWVKEEIEHILVNELGTKATLSINLMNTDLHPDVIMKGLRKMKKLRLVFVCKQYWEFNTEMGCGNISQLWEGGERKILNELKILRLENIKFEMFDIGYSTKLEWLDLNGCLLELHGPFITPKLRYLTLSYSKLSKLELGPTPQLEELDLRECTDLIELQLPIESPRLKRLVLSGSKLSKLELGLTPQLKELDLDGCTNLVELHMPVESPKLEILQLSGSKLSKLNLGLTPLLERLTFEKCYYLQEIYAPVGCLSKLVHLKLSGCSRFERFVASNEFFPPNTGSLATLELTEESRIICPLHPNNTSPKFQFVCFYTEPSPFSSGNIEKLLSFGQCICTNLVSFSATICDLQRLGKLTLEGSFLEAPKDLYQLENLEELTLLMKEIKHLPDSICMLKHLKSLKLRYCELLEQLPKDLGRLECLEELHLTDCISLRDIPNSICKMKKLKYLDLSYCLLVEKLPEEFGGLEEINIIGAGIKHLPHIIFQLKGLYIVGSTWRLESYGFTSLRNISTYTASCYIRDSQHESLL